jgi:hypothetical protein
MALGSVRARLNNILVARHEVAGGLPLELCGISLALTVLYPVVHSDEGSSVLSSVKGFKQENKNGLLYVF